MLLNDTMILQDGQRLGIGSGSTIVFAVDRIGQCIKCEHALSCDSHVRTCIAMCKHALSCDSLPLFCCL